MASLHFSDSWTKYVFPLLQRQSCVFKPDNGPGSDKQRCAVFMAFHPFISTLLGRMYLWPDKEFVCIFSPALSLQMQGFIINLNLALPWTHLMHLILHEYWVSHWKMVLLNGTALCFDENCYNENRSTCTISSETWFVMHNRNISMKACTVQITFKPTIMCFSAHGEYWPRSIRLSW